MNIKVRVIFVVSLFLVILIASISRLSGDEETIRMKIQKDEIFARLDVEEKARAQLKTDVTKFIRKSPEGVSNKGKKKERIKK